MTTFGKSTDFEVTVLYQQNCITWEDQRPQAMTSEHYVLKSNFAPLQSKMTNNNQAELSKQPDSKLNILTKCYLSAQSPYKHVSTQFVSSSNHPTLSLLVTSGVPQANSLWCRFQPLPRRVQDGRVARYLWSSICKL